MQQAVRRAVSACSGLAEAGLRFATDGCGVPTFALTVETMALMFARLVAPGGQAAGRLAGDSAGGLADDLAGAARRVAGAMTAHPEMVEGEY